MISSFHPRSTFTVRASLPAAGGVGDRRFAPIPWSRLDRLARAHREGGAEC